jgi:hypothetical protein
VEPQTIDVNAFAQAIIAMAQNAQGAGGPNATTMKAVSSTPRASGYAHGAAGLMSAPGMSREVINAMMLPHLGLLRMLPSRPSTEDFAFYGILTGQTAASGTFNGTNSAGVCGDPPTAGLLKLCTQMYRFGRQSMMTPVIELDRVGRTNNRSEFTDYRLVGGPYQADMPGAPTVPGDGGIQSALNFEVAKVSYELANDWVRNFGPFLFTGNRTNNTGGGIIQEYNGLDGLINTGYRDSDVPVGGTGTLCARADSLVYNYRSGNVETQAASRSGIVATITGIDRQLRYRATEMGLMPVKWVLVMRWSAFYQLTEVWPCAYSTYRCQTDANTGLSASQPAVNDSLRLQDMRNEMRGDWDARTGQFLWIDGVRRDVVIDDTIPETALAAGAFNSTIYWVPLTVIGGFQATYMEYFNYDSPQGAMAAAKLLAPGDSYFTTDGGRFLWHKRPPTAYCVQSQVKTEPRLILRTPQLAARLTNVAYTPFQHEDDWSTASNVYYFLNGGRTTQNVPSFFSPNTSVG